jgi:hypothetical protein
MLGELRRRWELLRLVLLERGDVKGSRKTFV